MPKGFRMAVRLLAALAGLTALGTLIFTGGADSARAAPQSFETVGQSDNSTSARKTRSRPQIRVTPRYPYRHYSSPYPVPYAAEYPGPYGVRQCVDRYVTEHRLSGTVIVPRMRCWWVVRR